MISWKHLFSFKVYSELSFRPANVTGFRQQQINAKTLWPLSNFSLWEKQAIVLYSSFQCSLFHDCMGQTKFIEADLLVSDALVTKLDLYLGRLYSFKTYDFTEDWKQMILLIWWWHSFTMEHIYTHRGFF